MRDVPRVGRRHSTDGTCVCVCPGDWCVPGRGHVIATRDLGTPRDTILHAAAGVYVMIMSMGLTPGL